MSVHLGNYEKMKKPQKQVSEAKTRVHLPLIYYWADFDHPEQF